MECNASECKNNELGYCASHKLYSKCKTRLYKKAALKKKEKEEHRAVLIESIKEACEENGLRWESVVGQMIPEETVMQKFRGMCNESLDPETRHKSDVVEHCLRRARKDLNYTRENTALNEVFKQDGETERLKNIIASCVASCCSLTSRYNIYLSTNGRRCGPGKYER